jgi:uncharacterized protein
MPPGPRWLYLHGLASSPQSTKAVALAEHFGRRGVRLERLDLRVPSMEHLRLSQIMTTVEAAIGGADDRALLFGSSLGGLAAARVAERDARVCALVLLAPAFRLFDRWRERLGDQRWQQWRERGWFAIPDHSNNRLVRLDFGFVEEAQAIDDRNDGWPDVRVPTLILHGQRDDIVPIGHSRSFAAGKPWVKLVELDDVHELTSSLPRIQHEADLFAAPFLHGA